MAIPAATPALIERVEPYCVIEQTIDATRSGGGREADRFLPEQQQRSPGQGGRFRSASHRQVVDRHQRVPGRFGVGGELGRRIDVPDVLVPIGHHRPAAIPSAAADDDHLGGEKRIRRAHDGSDVHVVLPVLDRHGELVSARIEVGDDRRDRPISVSVEDVAAVAVREQLGI